MSRNLDCTASASQLPWSTGISSIDTRTRQRGLGFGCVNTRAGDNTQQQYQEVRDIIAEIPIAKPLAAQGHERLPNFTGLAVVAALKL